LRPTPCNPHAAPRTCAPVPCVGPNHKSVAHYKRQEQSTDDGIDLGDLMAQLKGVQD